ncbi:MAG: hypothetical protein ACOYBJ_00245 [Patescibacteria group bacterium]|jgi:hypothetical protein
MSRKQPVKSRYNAPRKEGFFEKRYGRLYDKWQTGPLNPATQNIPHDVEQRAAHVARWQEPRPNQLHH